MAMNHNVTCDKCKKNAFWFAFDSRDETYNDALVALEGQGWGISDEPLPKTFTCPSCNENA